MTGAEAAQLLGVAIPAGQASIWDARAAEAVAHIDAECGGRFNGSLPAGVKMGGALLVKAMGENPAVSAQSLGDMSKSFFEGGTYKAAQQYWKRYRRVGFV